jgi:uncharacterized membrane protein YhaH (DUF805 family)
MNDIEDRKPVPKGMWLLFSFKGRISRKTFWIFNFFVFLAGMALGLITDPVHDISDISNAHIFFMLWMLWPNMAVQAKRWHDHDKSAAWLLINLVPYVGPIWALAENAIRPGTTGPNRFGPDPLEEPVPQ